MATDDTASLPEASHLLHYDERIAELVAEVEGLRTAMESRAVIEQAKGVLMAAMHSSSDAAFAVLVAASQRENRKVREIATEIVARASSARAGQSRSDPPSEGS